MKVLKEKKVQLKLCNEHSRLGEGHKVLKFNEPQIPEAGFLDGTLTKKITPEVEIVS